ncbi:hypothetical protein N7488_008373 [Penicillium malachiteum]|nr:hypothetical protein N7488_008373 [Penicillium malachiteum]
MDIPTHIIDPDGEVVIILRNADCPFAQNVDNMSTARDTDVHPATCDSPQYSAEATPTPECSPEYQKPTSKAKRNSKKKNLNKKNKHRASRRNLNEEPVAVPEEAVPEEAVPEEAVPEEAVPEEAVPEEAVPEEAVPEEAVPEEAVPEEATVEDPAIGELAAEYPEEAAVEDSAAEYPTPEEVTVDEFTADEYFAEASNNVCFRIQVSAKHMILASPVFKTMLTGDWKESITLAKKGLVEVDAEGWNIEALLIVLRAIHCQHYNIPQKLTLEMLAQVAVIADYYQCKEALHILKDIWIKNLDSEETIIPKIFSRDLVLWLWIAWFFQLPFEFKASTSIAMSHSDGWIDSWGLPVSQQVIGKDERSFRADSMNIHRQEAIDNLITFIHETRDAFMHSDRGCCFECRSIMYGALTMNMHSNNLLAPKPETPFLNLTYHSLVQRVLKFTSPKWYFSTLDYSGYSAYRSNSRHNCSDSSFGSVFMMLNNSLEGLELRMFTCS